MKHRAGFSIKQRKARSELMKLIHDKGFIRANPVIMSRVCGNPNCRCAKGQKHVSLYLSHSEEGSAKKLFVPKDYEERVRKWMENYQRIKQLIEEISEDIWEGIKERRFK